MYQNYNKLINIINKINIININLIGSDKTHCIKCAISTPNFNTNLCVKDCPNHTFSSDSVCVAVKNIHYKFNK